jgi:nitric oxide reductase activation protein
VDLTDDVHTERGEVTYPEWNVFSRSYKPDWCTVTEVPPAVSGGELRVGVEAHALRRSIARLGLDLERRRRQFQGDDIDIDALVEARAEVAAGSAPDEAIYVDSVRRRRELSVLVLLDISGSANEPSDAGGTVHEHQRAAAAALTQAVHQLGDRVALYGFRSQGRSAVQVVPVKRFVERFDARTLRRLDALKPAAYTRLGAAIRHGASVLEVEGGTVRRLLIVLSDGFAYDHGYEGAYGEADARRALAEARRRGSACLCLSIGAGTDADALRRVFGTAAYASFGRVDQVPATAGPLFRTALRLVEVQRRASQRNERTRERLQIERRTA